MKKVFQKVKKTIIGIIFGIITIPNKIFGISEFPAPVTDGTLYGPPNLRGGMLIYRITRIIIIPIALLIGLIIYFKRSKSSKKKKIIISICILILLVLIYF